MREFRFFSLTVQGSGIPAFAGMPGWVWGAHATPLRALERRLGLHPGEPFRGTLYIGVTADIARRSWQHREGVASGFTQRYKVHRPVYAEEYPTIAEAIAREKALKKWRRESKLELVEAANPDWDDLFDRLNG